MALTWLSHAEVPDLKPRKVMATLAGTSSTAIFSKEPKGQKDTRISMIFAGCPSFK